MRIPNQKTMKYINPIVITALLSAPLGHAAVTAYDPFLIGATPASGEYNVGNLQNQGPTVTGFTGTWLNNTGPQVSATGLSYSNGSGSLVTSGGSIATGDGGRVGRLLSAPVTDSSDTTLYMSVLLQLGTVTTDYKSFELHNLGFDDTNHRTLQLGQANDFINGATNYGIRLFGNDNLRLDLGAANTTVNLFVIKFVLSTADNGDSITVFRNPAMGGAEPGTNSGVLSNFNMTFDRTSLARFNDFSVIAADEIRFGDSFADVTPIPEPSSALLLVTAVLGLAIRRRR